MPLMTPNEPVSYLTLAAGASVYASDGTTIGTVTHVLADADADIFDGIVIDTSAGGKRFVDAPLVEAIDADGVRLTLDARQAEQLPEPGANPAEMKAGPDDIGPGGLSGKLRRAWDVISGNT